MNSRHDSTLEVTAKFASLTAMFGLFCTIMGCVTSPTSTTINCTTNAVGVVTCVTNVVPGVPTIDTNAVTQGIQLGATVATQEAVSADPTSVQYFVLATNVISDAILNGDLNPTNITSQISSMLGAKPNAQAIIGINGIMQAYQLFFAQQVANGLNANAPLFVQCLRSLMSGVAAGLPAITNAPAAPTQPSP